MNSGTLCGSVCADPSELLSVLQEKLSGLFPMQGHVPLVGFLESVLSLEPKGALYKRYPWAQIDGFGRTEYKHVDEQVPTPRHKMSFKNIAVS